VHSDLTGRAALITGGARGIGRASFQDSLAAGRKWLRRVESRPASVGWQTRTASSAGLPWGDAAHAVDESAFECFVENAFEELGLIEIRVNIPAAKSHAGRISGAAVRSERRGQAAET
jgi:NAD(P)-dependent dehydrogenase (short-subunit alcohol dehydrogenase family)